MKFIIAISAMLSLATALPIPTSVDIQETGGAPAPAAPSGCIESHNGGAYVSDDDCCATKGNGRCASGFTGGQTSTVCYNGEGWNAYRVKCQKEVPTAHKCSGTYREITGDEPNWGAVISGGSIANVASSAKCASLCDANQRCLSYEFYPTRNNCNLNKVTIPSVNQQHEDAIYCMKKQDCASGYTIVIGDEPNWGNVMAGGSKKDTSSSGACGSMCDAQDKCLSYEWYPTRQVCNLNIVAQPSDPNQHEDSVYCIKKTTAPTAHPTFTTGSPTRPPTRAPTRVPTGSPTRPPTRTRVLPGWCREWRHQNTGQSRKMHGTATYFTGTSVTQKSCIDRCDENPRCHQAVFEESGPWGPQCWLGNRKSSIIPKGSRNCSNAPASRPRVPCVDFCYNKEGWD